ncbi:TolC family protein [Candidatus Nitronereus thalassa]|uniref:TolC family protein n=1 Tax=Candidatus Nitronereus thalassa TaxID=3020898 RepID=A0ABU3KB33_9BACT|nr:TolC family protein [Candidatus Nitronereus thalassa]MDT7043694.1 TolC family protein [Candidatus Nitronereus thalassa]
MMKPKYCVRLFLFSMLFTVPSHPVDAVESLTVGQAVKTALERNPDLLAARQELEVARGREVKAQLFNRFNPSVNGQVWNRNNPGSGNVTDSQVLLSQEVEVAGQRGLRREAATRNVTQVEAQIKDRERLITGQVMRAFFQALTLEKRLELRKEIEKLNLRIRDASEARFKAGVAPIMESNLAEIRYGQSRKETFVAEALFQNALLDLRRLLGWEPDRSIELSGQLRNSPKAVPLSDLLQRAQGQRPDLMAAKREVARVEATMDLTRRLIVPNPTFQGFYQTETEGPGGASKMVGGGISIPFPLFDRKQGELVTQGGELNRSRHQVIAVTRNIEREVETAFQAYQAARQSVEVFEAEVLDRIDENFRFMEIAYREGKIGLLQLIVVQDGLITAQLSYVDSLGQFRAAETNLAQAVGGQP